MALFFQFPPVKAKSLAQIVNAQHVPYELITTGWYRRLHSQQLLCYAPWYSTRNMMETHLGWKPWIILPLPRSIAPIGQTTRANPNRRVAHQDMTETKFNCEVTEGIQAENMCCFLSAQYVVSLQHFGCAICFKPGIWSLFMGFRLIHSDHP